MFADPHRYDDMLFLPRHRSGSRLPMPRQKRAAQFAPFDALSGYGAAIRETARRTEEKTELDDGCKLEINRLLLRLLHLPVQPTLAVCWFRPDERKAGGRYCSTCGVLKKIDVFRQMLLLTDGTEIPLEDICRMECCGDTALDDLA